MDDNPFDDLGSVPVATPNPFPNATNQPARPTGTLPPSRATASRDRGNKSFPIWGYFVVVAGLLFIAPILCCGVFGLIGYSRMESGPSAMTREDLKAIPVPSSFPDLGTPEIQFPSGAAMYRVAVNGSNSHPGSRMGMRVYLPAGEHATNSLPCVLVTPAGTPLLHGTNVDFDDYHDETLPYCEAGMVVIHYSVDGAIPDSVNTDDEEAYSGALARAYPAFKESGGGVVNGRNALEYALAKIPAVDPNRICAAGHSSAGTLALMLAATEPRISHCAAYAPAYDCEKRMADAINDPMTRILLPGIKPFIRWYSPINHVDDIDCNVMIFHARDDGNVPFEDANRFVNDMKKAGNAVKFVATDSGGHYVSMIDEGIPTAIEWFPR